MTGGGWMSARRYCENGHDLEDFRNLYPQLPGRRPDRRCKACIKDANDLRRDAYTALGMTQREYLDTYGSSKVTARRILRELGIAS